jgi:hypothetical protein
VSGANTADRVTDDEIHIAAANPVPLIVALAVGERAVLDGNAVTEGAAEEGRHRWRQRDFRNQQQYLTAGAWTPAPGVDRSPFSRCR